MSRKIEQAVIGGIVATAVMTVVMYVGPMMGMPEMDAAAMLSMMLGVPPFVGWIMHFMIGATFAFSYAYLLMPLLRRVQSKVLKGVIFGIAIFIFAQIMMQIMAAVFGPMPESDANMALMILGSVIGHIVFGIVVALIIKDDNAEGK